MWRDRGSGRAIRRTGRDQRAGLRHPIRFPVHRPVDGQLPAAAGTGNTAPTVGRRGRRCAHSMPSVRLTAALPGHYSAALSTLLDYLPDSTVANSNGSRTLSDQVVSPNSGEQPRDNPPDIRRWARETGTPWAYEDVSIRSSSRRRTLVQGFKALGAEPLQVLVRFRADFADVVCRRAAPLPGRNRAYSGGSGCGSPSPSYGCVP